MENLAFAPKAYAGVFERQLNPASKFHRQQNIHENFIYLPV